MTDTTAPRTWLPLGKDKRPMTIGIVAAISVVTSIILVFWFDPVGQLIQRVFGVWNPAAGFIGGIVLMAALIGPIMLYRVPRPVSIDVRGAALRVGRREFAATELRHVWRTGTATANGTDLRIRLELPGVLDPVISLNTELSVGARFALRSIVEAAPIEVAPGASAVPPLGDELGDRAGAVVEDAVALALLDLVDASYPKATLLAQIDAIGAPVVGGAGDDPVRALQALVDGFGRFPLATSTAPEPDPLPPVTVTLTGMRRRAFRERQAAVEAWLAGAEFGGPVTRHQRSQRRAVVLIRVAFFLPAICCALFFLDFTLRFFHLLDGLFAVVYVLAPELIWLSGTFFGFAFFASLLAGPLLVLFGISNWWKASLARLAEARGVAVGIASHARRLPAGVVQLLQPVPSTASSLRFRSLGRGTVSILAFAMGLVFVSLGVAQAGIWPLLLGAALVALSLPALRAFYRVFSGGAATVLRREEIEKVVLTAASAPN